MIAKATLMTTMLQIILVMSGLTGTIMGVLLLVIAKKGNNLADGLIEWAYGLLILSLSTFLFLGRNYIPDLLSIVMANMLVIAGFMLMNQGLRKFFQIPIFYSKTVLVVFLTFYAINFVWFTYVDNNLFVRVILFTTSGLIVLVDGLLILLRNFLKGLGVMILTSAVILLILARLMRLIVIVLEKEIPATLFENSFSQLLIIASPYFAIPIATVAFVVLAYERLTQRLNQLLREDELTKTLNKKTFFNEAQKEIARALRYQHSTTFLMIDIDHFKEINDTRGHIYGDKVLKEIGQNIRSVLRATDLVSRFGGDEFMVALPETDIETAQDVARRIMTTIEKDPINGCTVSIGIAALTAQADRLELILNRADIALYQAKKDGRNQFALS